MIPALVSSIYVPDLTRSEILIKVALYWAELGESVWYISRQRITQLSTEFLRNVDKEALKQLIFIYAPRITDVAAKLHEIHMWIKTPRVIIVQDLDQYWEDINDIECKDRAAYFCGLLLDSAAVYSLKQKKMAYLIASSAKPKNEIPPFIYTTYFRYIHDGRALGDEISLAVHKIASLCDRAKDVDDSTNS